MAVTVGPNCKQAVLNLVRSISAGRTDPRDVIPAVRKAAKVFIETGREEDAMTAFLKAAELPELLAQ